MRPETVAHIFGVSLVEKSDKDDLIDSLKRELAAANREIEILRRALGPNHEMTMRSNLF